MHIVIRVFYERGGHTKLFHERGGHTKLFHEKGGQAGLKRRMPKYMLGTWHYYYLNRLLFTIGTSRIGSTFIYFRTSHTTYRLHGMVDYVVDCVNLCQSSCTL